MGFQKRQRPWRSPWLTLSFCRPQNRSSKIPLFGPKACKKEAEEVGQCPGSLTLRSTMLAGACRKSPSLHASAQTEAWQSVCFVHLNHCLYASYGLACEATREKVSVGIWWEKLPSLPVALTPCPESMTWNQPLCAYDEEERSGLNPLKWGEEISPQILSEAPR